VASAAAGAAESVAQTVLACPGEELECRASAAGAGQALAELASA
jgi:hypothetical protein